jgi:methyl-accepting chemotaxis protein
MLAATGAVVLTTVLSIAIVYYLSSHNRIVELHGKMSAIITQSEEVAENMDDMHHSHVFDMAAVREASLRQTGGRPLREAYASTDLYKTIPIVAAWRSVQGAADRNGFQFFTPSRPDVTPRNSKNDGAPFAEIFHAFDQGETEYFVHDRSHDLLVLARPVRLQASCLTCHGDPALSPTHDGKDVLGFPMENAKQGDIKGAFILKANIGHDPVVMATMKTMAIGGFVVLVLVLAGFHLFSSRSIVRPLSIAISHLETASIQTTAAAGEISGSSHSLAEGAAEQAAAIEQTSASLEELSSMTKGNAENSHKANELAKHSRATADRGLDDMRNMSAAMTAIRESSNNISVIIKTIDEIAFQTNILALNAAVEAARAGEAGMGFAVVANEVRSLAQRSAQAAKETAVKIEDAIGKAALGVEINQKVGNALNEIVGKAYEMDKLAAGVASASSEQTQGITQINVAVGEMDKVVQANAASAEECAAAAAELNAQAGAMREAVTDLVQLVGHHAGKSAAAPKAAPQRAEKAIPAAMPSTHAANGHGRSVIPAKPKLADRRKELPMDGDFKDF